ncbi:MAG: polysaccharide biosynthesis tyrosine autokinase [Methylococcales bacterium]
MEHNNSLITGGDKSISNKENEDIDIREFWGIIRRHSWKIIGLMLLAALLSAIVVLPQKSVYRSTATLLLDPEVSKIAPVESLYGIKSGEQYYKTQYQILQSNSLAKAVILRMELDKNSEFQSKKKTGWFAKLKVDLVNKIKSIFIANDEDSDNELNSNANSNALEAIVSKFQTRLTIDPVRDSQLVNVSFDAYDPVLAAQVANTIANTYIKADLESKHVLTSDARKILADQLEELRTKLETSENALQDYREKEKLVEMGGTSSVASEQLHGLNQELMIVQQQLSREEAALQQISALEGASIDRLSSTPAVLSDSLVVSLKQAATTARRTVSSLEQRYGPMHPKLVQAKADLSEARVAITSRVSSVIAGAEREYNVTKSRAAAIQNSIWQTKSTMQTLNRKSYGLQALEREAESNRQLYQRFLGRLKETQATGLSKAVAVISDPASPSLGPIRPKKSLIIMIASILGMSLGILISLLLEHLDNTIKKESDLVDRLNISLLGLLPHVSLNKTESSFTYAADDKVSFFSESIRTVRTAIQLSGMKSPYKIIVITSSIPGEGKSTVAANIAMSLGDMHKVLLIDADLRRPRVSGAMDLENKTKGLAELISQKIDASECYYKVGNNDLYVMPVGSVADKPLDLISSKYFYDALSDLREIFDYIIIDTPPVMAVSDALVLSTYASGVIYVIKAESTPFPVVADGVKRVRDANPRIIGGILNDVPHKRKGMDKLDYYSDSHYGPYGYSNG